MEQTVEQEEAVRTFQLLIKKVHPEPGDVVLVTADEGYTSAWRDLKQAFETFRRSLPEGTPLTQPGGFVVLFANTGVQIKKLSEAEMNVAGWYRACGKPSPGQPMWGVPVGIRTIEDADCALRRVVAMVGVPAAMRRLQQIGHAEENPPEACFIA